jgi:hypothetical protein
MRLLEGGGMEGVTLYLGSLGSSCPCPSTKVGKCTKNIHTYRAARYHVLVTNVSINVYVSMSRCYGVSFLV